MTNIIQNHDQTSDREVDQETRKDVHIVLDEPFLRWAHTILAYPTLRHTVWQLKKSSPEDLGVMWQIYKGANLPIPRRIALHKKRFFAAYKTCLTCKAQLICRSFSFNVCRCSSNKGIALVEETLKDRKDMQTELKNAWNVKK